MINNFLDFKQMLKRQNLSKKSANKSDVFLGGSCNPTTWRTEIAIPLLRRQGISYYNPQVQHWRPELIELECRAKQNAEVLFFVIDNQTRSVASMIETSYMAGLKRKLILVVNEYRGPDFAIYGESISDKELKDLKEGHDCIRDIADRQGIPVFDDVMHALPHVINSLKPHTKPTFKPSGRQQNGEQISYNYDIYLGGPTHNSTWREDIAITFLKNQSLKYLAPQNGSWNGGRSLSSEACNIRKCKVLLFTITKQSRSLSSMILAAHYIALGCNVVLCIQEMDEDCVIAGEKLSRLAINDYNRGRYYLTDLANKAGVPVFKEISEALMFSVQKCKSLNYSFKNSFRICNKSN